MGYATKDELAAFQNEQLEAERAGTGVAMKSGAAAAGTKFADLLRDVHHEEARWCAMLLKQLKVLGAPASTKIGAFQEKALAIPGLPERMAFLNRGQGWVVKKLREMLPKVRDDGLHRDSSPRCCRAHEVNIARTSEALQALVKPVDRASAAPKSRSRHWQDAVALIAHDGRRLLPDLTSPASLRRR